MTKMYTMKNDCQLNFKRFGNITHNPNFRFCFRTKINRIVRFFSAIGTGIILQHNKVRK
jgi:hypothetical protein